MRRLFTILFFLLAAFAKAQDTCASVKGDTLTIRVKHADFGFLETTVIVKGVKISTSKETHGWMSVHDWDTRVYFTRPVLYERTCKICGRHERARGDINYAIIMWQKE